MSNIVLTPFAFIFYQDYRTRRFLARKRPSGGPEKLALSEAEGGYLLQAVR